MFLSSLLALCWASPGFGCQGFGDEQSTSELDLNGVPTWDTGIRRLMAFYCNRCHDGSAIDPSLAYFRTDTYYDTADTLGVYSQRERHLSRVLDPARPMPPPPMRALSSDEVAYFRAWLDLGAPIDPAAAEAGVTLIRCPAGLLGACACTGGYYGSQRCLEDGTFADCDCAGSEMPTGAEPTGPLADLLTRVFRPSCAGSGCHTSGGARPDLVTWDGLRDRLLGPSLQAPELRYVEPGQPGASYLFSKLQADFSSLGVGRGQSMPPPGSAALEPDVAGMIEAWILQGALP